MDISNLILQTVVVDDEPLAADLMEEYVRKTPFLKLAGSYSNGNEAFAALKEKPADLIFCDIQMPGLSGIDFSKMVSENTKVVFVTAYGQYAIEGFKVNAIDYLLKPVSYDDFLKSAKRALDWFGMRAQAEYNESIWVKSDYRIRQIPLESILYAEGCKDYVKIHLSGSDTPVLSLMSMKSLEAKLPSKRFRRVHKSFIVQVSKIESFSKNHLIVNGTSLPVSDSFKNELAEIFR